MCYTDGADRTHDLFKELHRVLKLSGRLITISLHKESEVDIFATTLFAVTTGKLRNLTAFDKLSSDNISESSLYNTLAVFDKLQGGGVDGGRGGRRCSN